MSDNKKQMMDIQKVKSFSVAVSDEHQRNWGDDLFSRKENDPKYNYDRSRTRLNFQVSKGGELGPVDKTKSITDKIEQAIKNRVTGRVNATSNRAVSLALVVTVSRCANSHLATSQSVRTAATGMLTVAVA